jgi:hypothetical protein
MAFTLKSVMPETQKGVKIRSESKAAMENAAKQYSRYKEVTILGEYKNGVRLTKETA